MDAATPVHRGGRRGRQARCFGEIGDGRRRIAQLHVGNGAVVEGRRIGRRQQNGALEIFHRLLRHLQRQEHIAPIVVDGGQLGIDLRRLVEVVERSLQRAQPPLRNAPVVQQRGQLVAPQARLVHLAVERFDRLGEVAAQQGLAAQRGVALLGLGCASRQSQDDRNDGGKACHPEMAPHWHANGIAVSYGHSKASGRETLIASVTATADSAIEAMNHSCHRP